MDVIWGEYPERILPCLKPAIRKSDTVRSAVRVFGRALKGNGVVSATVVDIKYHDRIQFSCTRIIAHLHNKVQEVKVIHLSIASYIQAQDNRIQYT